MIYFSDNLVTYIEDSEAEDFTSSEVPEAEDVTSSEVPEAEDVTSSEVPEAEDVISSEGPAAEDLTSSEGPAAEEFTSSVDLEHSANGESQQSVIPPIVNDIVVPDNSYSKFCFFFLMLLFALFVGRSFRKGV